jgi:hypothetical protein
MWKLFLIKIKATIPHIVVCVFLKKKMSSKDNISSEADAFIYVLSDKNTSK